MEPQGTKERERENSRKQGEGWKGARMNGKVPLLSSLPAFPSAKEGGGAELVSLALSGGGRGRLRLRAREGVESSGASRKGRGRRKGTTAVEGRKAPSHSLLISLARASSSPSPPPFAPYPTSGAGISPPPRMKRDGTKGILPPPFPSCAEKKLLLSPSLSLPRPSVQWFCGPSQAIPSSLSLRTMSAAVRLGSDSSFIHS